MNPLTSMTSTETENLAQQYQVHEVMTPEEQCFYPDLNVLTTKHWTMTARSTQECSAAAGSFCFVTTDNGEQQDISNVTTKKRVCSDLLCLDELTNDSSSTQVEFSQRSRHSNQRHAGTLYGHLWRSSKSKGQEEIPCTKGSIISGSTRILQTVC